MYVCVYTHVCVHMYVHAYMYIYVHAHTHTHIHISESNQVSCVCAFAGQMIVWTSKSRIVEASKEGCTWASYPRPSQKGWRASRGVYPFHLLHAPSSPPPMWMGTGVRSLHEVTEYVPGLEWVTKILEKCSLHQDYGLRWGPRQHKLCPVGTGTQGETSKVLIALEKYKVCSSFH